VLKRRKGDQQPISGNEPPSTTQFMTLTVLLHTRAYHEALHGLLQTTDCGLLGETAAVVRTQVGTQLFLLWSEISEKLGFSIVIVSNGAN
jgi:hypothetical protein